MGGSEPRKGGGGVWLVAAGALLIFGCGSAEVKRTYDNRRALESRVERPVSGTATERTYRNPRFRGVRFDSVWVEEPRLQADRTGDPDYVEFLDGLREALWAGTAQALRDAGRYGVVAIGPETPGTVGPGHDVVCRIEALPHVAALGQPVRRDAVFRDTRPKVITVFTVTDPRSGDVVLKYTAWAVSQWDYGPWAMQDLQNAALRLAGEFGEVLQQE